MSELIKDPTEEMRKQEDINRTYIALAKSTEYWIAVGRGAFVFRFGPYTGPESGIILNRLVSERIAATIIGNCGREFDYELAKDMGMKLVLEGDEGYKP